MKRFIAILSLFLLMINFSACEKKKTGNGDIYSEIHTRYYSIKSYSADCTVTAYTTGGENTYECSVDYDSSAPGYKIVSDDLTVSLTPDKTIITKGDNTIESVPSDADMYIFVNTFFESYYEAEDTTISVSENADSKQTLLECSLINPTDFASSMKLWIDNDSVLPQKMQVFNKNNEMTSEIIFNSFKFNQ